VIFVPDIQPQAVESFWPTSVIGWLTFATLATAVGKTAYDWFTGRRKSLTSMQGSIGAVDRKVDSLCGQIADMEGDLKVVDGLSRSVGELLYEWRGVDGSNGYKSIIKRHDHELIEIRRRNDKIDAVREAHEADLQRSGGVQRRRSDRELNNLLPEEREEKG
jgi:hypothetical protein